MQGNARKFVRKDVSVEAMAKAAVVPVNDKAGKAPDKSIIRCVRPLQNWLFKSFLQQVISVPFDFSVHNAAVQAKHLQLPLIQVWSLTQFYSVDF